MVTPEVTQKTMRSSMEVIVTKEGERIFQFCAAMNKVAENTLFKKRASYLVIYKSALSKTQVNYCLKRRNQSKFLKDINLT